MGALDRLADVLALDAVARVRHRRRVVGGHVRPHLAALHVVEGPHLLRRRLEQLGLDVLAAARLDDELAREYFGSTPGAAGTYGVVRPGVVSGVSSWSAVLRPRS